MDAVCDREYDSLAWTIALRLESQGYHCPVNREDSRIHQLNGLFPDLIIYQGAAGKTRLVAVGKIWKEPEVNLGVLKKTLCDYQISVRPYRSSVYLFVEQGLYKKAKALAASITPAPSVFWFERQTNQHWELDPGLFQKSAGVR
jgi:hypothetical protein